MSVRISIALICAVLTPLATGCGTQSNASTQATSLEVDGAKYVLAEEPDGAMGVIEARQLSEDGEELVLVGRIGGAANPWIEGRAAFMLLDPSMVVVDESEGMAEGQLCTADCCATERLECTTVVKFVDASGAVVSVDARKLLGVSEDDMVVVKGTAKRDKSGNFQLLATGLYNRK